jgi:putative hydrolases of HD superfamily
MTSLEPFLEFARTVGRLKTVVRQGWVDRGVAAPESVADHTYRAVMLAWTLGAAAGLDTNRLVKIMLVHDLAEAWVGDATPYEALLDVSRDAETVQRWRELLPPDQLAAAKREKHAREQTAFAGIIANLPQPLVAELRELADDYADRRTAEGEFAAQIDKIEALLQAVEYRERGQPSDVENFLASAREAVTHPVLAAFVDEVAADARLSAEPDSE